MKNFFKKIILLFTLGISGVFFLSPSIIVNAETVDVKVEQNSKNSGKSEQEKADKFKIYTNLGQGLYAITWPLIMIAGKFMENDVIYGSFIGIDALLWKIWNIMRTFANYIIGIILIFSIFTLFLGGKFEQFNPIKIIPQLVVSSLLVNASWFILGACLDLSTILTYSVGMLPIKMGEDELKLNKTPVPTFAIEFQNDKTPIKVGVKDGKNGDILPFCEMTSLTGEGGGVKLYIPKNAGKNGCAYRYNTGYYAVTEQGKKIVDGQKPDFGKPIKTKTFGELKKEHPGMTTILGTLYASILDIGKLASKTSGTTVGMTTDLLFKFIFLLALIIPLFTFALIMIARAVVLWMFIIISPIIFLFTSIKGIGDKLLGEKGTLKEMCCMVFLPVTVTFALSISFVFLSVLNFSKLNSVFGIDGKGNEVYIDIDGENNHKITIKYKDTGEGSATTNLYGLFHNTMLWIIKLMFAIGFMWILVFTALKSCKITSGIAIFVGNFAKNMAKAAPILPFAGGQSIASLGQGLKNVASLPGQEQNKQRQGLENMFKEMTGKEKEQKNIENISKSVATIEQDTQTQFNKVFSTPIKYKDEKGVEKSIDLKKTSFENLLNNKKALSAVASQLGITAEKLEKILSKQKNQKATVDTASKDIEEVIRDEKLRKMLNNALTSNITIEQLSDNAKQIIQKILSSSSKVTTKPNIGDIKAFSQILAQALKEFGISNENIKKLIAPNLVGDMISDHDKKKVEEIIKNLK